MRFDVITLFPEMCEMILRESILGRAEKNEFLSFHFHHIREYTLDKHRNVDDRPYGGGGGMLLCADPIYRAHAHVQEETGGEMYTIYMSPQGKTLTQTRATELSQMQNITVICGHYEGVDERLIEEIVDEEISIGDYVLTGGELPAMVLIDTIARLRPGVLAAETSFTEESHFDGLLEYPHYTRPEVWHDRVVPDVLLSGHHANIKKWRREQALIRTFQKRPELLRHAKLTADEKVFLKLQFGYTQEEE